MIIKGEQGGDHCGDGTGLHLDFGGVYTNLFM